MERQNSEAQAAAAPQEIEPAPPEYTPRLPPKSEIQAAQDPTAGSRGPVEALPTDLSGAGQKTYPMQPQPMASGQPVAGVIPLDRLGDSPQWIDCPFCQQRTLTRLRTEGTPMQIVAGVACCLLCVFLTCIPCLAHWFEETNYFCSSCNKQVAKRSDSGRMVVYAPDVVVPSKYA